MRVFACVCVIYISCVYIYACVCTSKGVRIHNTKGNRL